MKLLNALETLCLSSLLVPLVFAVNAHAALFEGMLVRVEQGLITGPTDRYGDASLVANDERSFREEGIAYPGLMDLPIWDGNPEVFEINPNGVGGANVDFDAGTEILVAEGPLSFSYGDYQLLPTRLKVGTLPQLPLAVRAVESNEITVGSLNMYRFYKGRSTTVYEQRLSKFSGYIRSAMGAPDILAVQEVDDILVLQELSATLFADDAHVRYTPYLIEGNDVGGIDVGFLVRENIQTLTVTQLGANEVDSVRGRPLHDRPPLVLSARATRQGKTLALSIMVVHNRSLSKVDHPTDGERVRIKCFEQAQSIATHIKAMQDANEHLALLVIGDFNAFQFSDGYVDAIGQIRGDVEPEHNLLSGPEILKEELENQIDRLDEHEQYSFIFNGNAQVLVTMMMRTN